MRFEFRKTLNFQKSVRGKNRLAAQCLRKALLSRTNPLASKYFSSNNRAGNVSRVHICFRITLWKLKRAAEPESKSERERQYRYVYQAVGETGLLGLRDKKQTRQTATRAIVLSARVRQISSIIIVFHYNSRPTKSSGAPRAFNYPRTHSSD